MSWRLFDGRCGASINILIRITSCDLKPDVPMLLSCSDRTRMHVCRGLLCEELTMAWRSFQASWQQLVLMTYLLYKQPASPLEGDEIKYNSELFFPLSLPISEPVSGSFVQSLK